MTTLNPRAFRRVIRRRGLLLAAMGSVVAAPIFVQADTGEGGEGGEGAAALGLPPRVEALLLIGLYDASMRIVAELYAAGEVAEAQMQLEGSHHAHYEDIAARLAAIGATGFDGLAGAFAEAVGTGAEAAVVAARHAEMQAAIEQAYARGSAGEMMQMAERLVRTAYADFYGGTYEGEVVSAHEYRDAWGFATVAHERMAALAEVEDPTVADAGQRGVAALAPVWALFPGLMATEVPDDPSLLAGAAARIEIAGLRLS